jgi:hypothetical protein
MSTIRPEWIERIWWREAWLTLEAADGAVLPPYLGSTLRGALGRLLRAALCEAPGCGHACQRPETCRYYSLFERNGGGAKPFLMLAPAPPGLEEIATGGPVKLPYRTGPPRSGETIPALRRDAGIRFRHGETIRFGLRLVGPISNTLPAIVEAVARFGLSLGGAPFRLVEARDGLGRAIHDRRWPEQPVQLPARQKLTAEDERARRIRIVYLSPTLLKLGREPAFAVEDLAARFFEHCAGRAVRMYQTCCGARLPWEEVPPVRADLAGYRLFHYELPRHSFRQEKWLHFDGVVGWMDLEGDMGAAMPYARAAEILHFGQKAAFGLGKIRVLALD